MKKIIKGLVVSVAVTMIIPTFALASTTSGQVIRLSGATRYDTAISIANELAKNNNIDLAHGGKFDAVVIASGNNYPDALSGASLANQVNAPILLVDQTPESSATTLNYIKQNVKPDANIYLLGGTGVIPASFTYELTENLGFNGAMIHQIGGVDRDATSLITAEKLTNPGKEVCLVSDSNFYDALTIAPFFAYDDAPLLLVSSSGLSAGQKTFCDSEKTVAAVGEIVSTISQTYPKALGVSGANKYDTNALFSAQLKDRPYIFLATGEDFPDALAGSVMAGSEACPIVLTTPDTLQPETIKALNIIAYNDKLPVSQTNKLGQTVSLPAVGVPTIYVLGGTGAVSDSVVSQVQSILSGPGYTNTNK